MAARPPLPVPYGLSREYEDFLTKGKPTTKHIEQLRSRSTPIFTAAISSHAQNRKLPISTASAASFAPNRPCRVSKSRKSDIGSQRNITPPLSKPKLVRAEKRFKSSVFIPEALICPPILRQQIRTSVGARLDAHLGTCHESPITLDSDSEEPVKPIKPDAALRDASGSNSITVRHFTSKPDAVHVPYPLPASVTPAIRKSATSWRPSPHAIPQTKTETVTASEKTYRVHIESRPNNMRDARSSRLFSRIKPSTPGPWHYRSLHPQLKNRPQDTNDGHPKDTELVDMTLMDIEDFDLRSKVAHLMAVAPALPIRDLYHLVVNSQGRMSKAIKRASRMSGAPHQVSKTTISNHSDTKETMVKIDPNDTTFEWDNDEPTEPIPTTLRSTKQKPSKPAHKVYKRVRDEY